MMIWVNHSAMNASINSFQMFRKLHTGYTDMICCPFYNPGDQIKSK